MSFPIPWAHPETKQPLAESPEALLAPDGQRFPIENGIPRFVPGEDYVTSFGDQWNEFPKTQLDSYTGLPISRDRVHKCLGDAIFNNLRGTQVLEAGCGAGRFTEVLLAQGAQVTSLDLSHAVDANARNFPINAQHRIAQADILRLPFAPNQYDGVFCLGVIQHTPDTERSITSLYEQVKPGGWLAIDHYTHERRWGNLKPFYRAWLKRQPSEKVFPLIERFVEIYLPWHQRFRHIYPLWFLLCRISPLTTYYRSMPELSEPLQREFALLDTHDSLTDWYKHIRNKEQIEAHLRSLGAVDIRTAYAGNGVEAVCRKPAR